MLPTAAVAGHTAILQWALDECLSGMWLGCDQELGWIHEIVGDAQDGDKYKSTAAWEILKWAKSQACPGGGWCYPAFTMRDDAQSCGCECVGC